MDGSIATARRDSGTEWLAVVAILLLPVLRHGAELTRPFFADDYLFLEQVRRHGLLAALTSPDPLGNFVRPIGRQLYFWIVATLGGERPEVFRLVNWAIFSGALLLLYRVVRRRAGAVGTFAAVTFLALHYATDVPLLWVSGCQDLLALAFALACLDACDRGRSPIAAALFALGLLSKETIALTPLIALFLARGDGRSWRDSVRRVLPLLAVLAIWACAMGVVSFARRSSGSPLSLTALSVPAALLHLIQVSAGAELRALGNPAGHWRATSVIAGLAALLVTWIAARVANRSSGSELSRPSRGSTLLTGVVWAIAGALPVAFVLPIWSAYFYLFALCGVALVLAGIADSAPPPLALAIVSVLAVLSANASHLDEFARDRGRWTWQSHVNRHYLSRAMAITGRYLSALRTAHPTLPPRSTLFFADVPVSLGWQAGDGPLVRWAYRDSSLRSYYLTSFTLAKAARGPVFFLVAVDDSLVDRTNDPALLPSLAYSMILAERPAAARDAITWALERAPADRELRYWRAWTEWALGDTTRAIEELEHAGFVAARHVSLAHHTPAPTAADSSGALARLLEARNRAALDPAVHARLAALGLAMPDARTTGVIEAWVNTLLQPRSPDAWRKWASAQLAEQRYEEALTTLERYFRMGGDEARRDAEAVRVAQSLERVVRGDLSRTSVRHAPAE